MRSNIVLYYMEDAGGGEEAKSACPWGDLREFWSRLAPSTSTKALGMGFASQQEQELQEEDRERASWEHSQHAGHPEVSPTWHRKAPQQPVLPAPSPGATRGRAFCSHAAQGRASLPKAVPGEEDLPHSFVPNKSDGK